MTKPIILVYNIVTTLFFAWVYFLSLILKLVCVIIKTHGSELRGQEEAGLHDKRLSYLHVAPL